MSVTLSITIPEDFSKMAQSFKEEFDVSLQLVKKCGDIILEAFYKKKNVSEKGKPNDLVTETDLEVERRLIGGLREQFPNHQFIGEESVAGGEKCQLTDDPTWVIDPIDGTTNFVHSNPHVCTILAFMVDKEVEFTIINNPILGQLWTAQRGKGAFYNGKKIAVSSCNSLKESMLNLDFNWWGEEERNQVLKENANLFFGEVQATRSYGSAGITLAHLAMGAIDCYFEFGIHIWDYAGGALMVR